MAIPKVIRKGGRMSAWESVFEMLMTGEPVEKSAIETMLGETAYKVSAHILEIKIQTKAIIRVKKEGRKVLSYQLANPSEVMSYWNEREIVPNAVRNLSDLDANPVETEVVQSETEEV